MYLYRLTPNAFRQLDKELTYSASKWGKRHAVAYERELVQKVRTIAKNPKIHPLNPNFGEGARAARYKGNYIVYMIDEAQKIVEILNFPSVYATGKTS